MRTRVRAVLIRGEGVAASCCARLLQQRGLRLTVETVDRPKLPAIMLSEASQKLLRDVFERHDLFDGFHRIRKRVVAWGVDAKVIELPHSAVVVCEQTLLDRLQRVLPPPDQELDGEARWTIFTSRPLPESSAEHHFGSRTAVGSAVKFKNGVATDACWIESLPDGWLFLLPVDDASGWLLSVGNPVESLLAASRLIVDQIAEVGHSAGRFPSHPRIADPLEGPGWLACGTPALGFDPLCGDGAGHATREAILGSAVVCAASNGADVHEVTAHYRTRLLAGFRKHLDVCCEFYQSGCRGPWWDQQVADLRRGLQWTGLQMQGAGTFRYRLNGFSLEAVK